MKMMMQKIKIVLADDHSILREGLKNVLSSEDGFEVIGEAANGDEAVKICLSLKPDVAILDINMPQLTGLEAAKLIKKKSPEINILILSMYDNENFISEAINLGINGYILKMSDMDELIKAIKAVADGNAYFPTSLASKILQKLSKTKKTKNDSSNLPLLTTREKEIIKLIVEGYTSQQIADRLFISYFTVGKHRKNIHRKFGIKNTVELVKYVIDNDIISQV